MRFIVATSPKYQHLMRGFAIQWARYMAWHTLPFCTAEADWSGSLWHLLDSLEDPYIGLALDDYWMIRAPDQQGVTRLMEELGNCDKVDLQGQVGYWPHTVEDGICVATQTAPYRTSTQLAVWRRQYLMGLLASGGPSPWQFELQPTAANDRARIVGLQQSPCQYANIYLKGKAMQYELDRLSAPDIEDLRDKGALDLLTR